MIESRSQTGHWRKMIPSQSSAQPVASLSSADGDWDKEDRTSQGFRLWLRPAKITAGSGAPPPEEKSN